MGLTGLGLGSPLIGWCEGRGYFIIASGPDAERSCSVQSRKDLFYGTVMLPWVQSLSTSEAKMFCLVGLKTLSQRQ